MVQKLVTCGRKQRRVIPALDIGPSSSAPKHLVMFPNEVAPVGKRHRHYMTPHRKSHPETCRKRNQAFIIDFLIATTYTQKKHLVNGIPPMSKDVQVELGNLADMIHHTAL